MSDPKPERKVPAEHRYLEGLALGDYTRFAQRLFRDPQTPFQSGDRLPMFDRDGTPYTLRLLGADDRMVTIDQEESGYLRKSDLGHRRTNLTLPPAELSTAVLDDMVRGTRFDLNVLLHRVWSDNEQRTAENYTEMGSIFELRRWEQAGRPADFVTEQPVAALEIDLTLGAQEVFFQTPPRFEHLIRGLKSYLGMQSQRLEDRIDIQLGEVTTREDIQKLRQRLLGEGEFSEGKMLPDPVEINWPKYIPRLDVASRALLLTLDLWTEDADQSTMYDQ